MNEDRVIIIQKLGGKCVKCNATDIRILHMDHILGHGYLDKQIFSNTNEMYSYYLKYFDDEKKYLQVLCNNHNVIKRHDESEDASRPSFDLLFRYFMESLLKDEISEIKQKLQVHYQFIPIFFRFARKFKLFTDTHSFQNSIKPKFDENDYQIHLEKQNIKKFAESKKYSEFEIPFEFVDGKVDLSVLQGKPRREVSKMELFMNTLRDLEGNPKEPVEKDSIINTLVDTGKFTNEEVIEFIKRMGREGVIFESKPNHYNRIN